MLSLCVDDDDTMAMFNLLESHPDVVKYKVAVAGVGELTDSNIDYLYGGYKFPAGKLVEKLY